MTRFSLASAALFRVCCFSVSVMMLSPRVLASSSLSSRYLEGGNLTGKQLVVLAGPHKTAETAVEEFFYSYARGDNPALDVEKSLLGWSWPQVLGLGPPHKAYDRLVADADDPDIQRQLLTALSDHAASSSRGIIMGGDEFDRVGNTTWSNWDAAAAVELARSTLDIAADNVTIVLLYQHPRVDQWLSIFVHDDDLTEGHSDKFNDRYHQFLCDPATAKERRETLETAMNPFLVASIYLDHGWDVTMVDLEGLREAGLEVEHVIGCEVLGGTCSDPGWLDGLTAARFEQFSKRDDQLDHPFSELTINDLRDLESLFRLRDCHFQSVIQHPRFNILHNTSIFMTCPDDPRHIPEDLANTDTLFNAIQSQKKCNSVPMSLSTMLGEAPKITLVDPTKYIEFGENEESSSTNTTSARPSWHVALFFSAISIAGVMSVIWIAGADKRGAYTQGGLDGIIPHVTEDPKRPLSEIL